MPLEPYGLFWTVLMESETKGKDARCCELVSYWHVTLRGEDLRLERRRMLGFRASRRLLLLLVTCLPI